MTKTGIFILIILAVLGAIIFVESSRSGGNAQVACTLEAMQCPDGSYVGRSGPNCEFAKCPEAPLPTEKQNVESYIRANISTISPVKPVLGGSWYVVSITVDTDKNTGNVVYEDGHIQEKKDFSYTTNSEGAVTSVTLASTK
jgi:hypothetical protein